MVQVPRAPLSPLVAGEHLLPKDLGQYLVRVLRLRAGDTLVLFDPESGTEALATVLRDLPTLVRVAEPHPVVRRTLRELALLQGFSKGDKPEQVVRAAVALGASAVTFVRTERGVSGAELRVERLRAVMVDAARQCGRGDLPVLSGLVELDEALATARGLRLLLAPEAVVPLAHAVAGAPPRTQLTLAIGAEGGFSEHEVSALHKAAFEPVRLGQFVLRTELAAVAALAVVAAHE